MVFLRSHRETRDDARFVPIRSCFFPPPFSSSSSSVCLEAKMRVLPCRVFRSEDEVLYSPFLGFIACTMGFNGEGKTLYDTADDTCRKLVSYMERRLGGGQLPYHDELSAIESECWTKHRKLFGEKDFEEHEAKGEMEWGSPTDFVVYVELLEGIVNQVGWREESSEKWVVWTMPGFSSLH